MHEHETDEQLRARLDKAAQQVHAGAYYTHYKQLKYKVVSLALREEDNEPCVIRPVVNWLETVEVDGKTVSRFTEILE
jgi:hypothetical protein